MYFSNRNRKVHTCIINESEAYFDSPDDARLKLVTSNEFSHLVLKSSFIGVPVSTSLMGAEMTTVG